MSGARKRLRIGFMPLVDAAALIVAVDARFTANEGLDVELVREVSWSNIRDKLAIGLFDAAHLLAPMAIGSSLGLGQVRAPLVAPMNLAMNGNAITVSGALYRELLAAADGDLLDPAASARALAAVIRARETAMRDPLTFAMTFPFSTHNYQLRYWMGSGGIDPDHDLRLVALPPPYMVESMAQGQVDGFCVGAPWSSVAVEADVGRILHFGCDIFARAPEKVLALRARDAEAAPDVTRALTRAIVMAARYIDAPENQDRVAALLARADRVGVDARLIQRSLVGRLKIDAGGDMRANVNYLLIGKDGALRPDTAQAVWLYAQMLRWGQADLSAARVEEATRVFRADLFDAAIGARARVPAANGDPVGAFDGARPIDELRAYLSGFTIGRKF